MRILFLVTRLDKASARYRILQYRPYLEAAGFDVQIQTFANTWREKLKLLDSANQVDCVVIQKKLMAYLDLKLLRACSKKLIFDFDDAIMFPDSHAKANNSTTRIKKFSRMVKTVDTVIAGNAYLADRARPYTNQILCIPTCIDLSRYLILAKEPGHTVTLGWIGSAVTLPYLDLIRDPLEKIGEKYPNVRLKIVSNEFINLKNIDVIRKVWNYDEEIEDLNSFDIGLMPLSDDPWTRGKCGFKLLQCMAVGKPVVCSPVGVNRDIVKPNMNGFWAQSDEEWHNSLTKLIDDIPLRHRLGQEARRTIASQYNLASYADVLIEQFRALQQH